MKDKLIEMLGVAGLVLYYIFRLVASIMPFVMIGASLFATIILILISGYFPLATPVFWIWGLICAFKGPQDFWAFAYYILFVIVTIPFISIIVEELANKKHSKKTNYKSKLKGNSEAKRKADLFRDTIRNEVITLQSKNYPSCEELVMDEVDKVIEESCNEFGEWEDDVDFLKVSLTNLYNITFDMLSTGKYHVYSGVLNVTGNQLRNICTGCLYKAYKNNYITEEEYEDQLTVISESIQNIG